MVYRSLVTGREDERLAESPGTGAAHLIDVTCTPRSEQPAALRATIDALLPRAGRGRGAGRDTRQVLFIARGTSDNAAVYGSYLIQAYAGRLATLASPSIATTYRSRVDLSGVLAVALSQSGQTDEIVETLAWASDCGARTLAITMRRVPLAATRRAQRSSPRPALSGRCLPPRLSPRSSRRWRSSRSAWAPAWMRAAGSAWRIEAMLGRPA